MINVNLQDYNVEKDGDGDMIQTVLEVNISPHDLAFLQNYSQTKGKSTQRNLFKLESILVKMLKLKKDKSLHKYSSYIENIINKMINFFKDDSNHNHHYLTFLITYIILFRKKLFSWFSILFIINVLILNESYLACNRKIRVIIKFTSEKCEIILPCLPCVVFIIFIIVIFRKQNWNY